MSKFDYLLDKINNAKFSTEPFSHLLIEDFLSDEHFEQIVSSSQLNKTKFSDTRKMLECFLDDGFEIATFPGCIKSVDDYVEFIDGGMKKVKNRLIEGYGKGVILSYGMAIGIKEHKHKSTENLVNFVKSSKFKSCLESKFKISRRNYIDTNIQKYFSGYEISPHPDARRKALTYMLNINTDVASEKIQMHTKLMTFKDRYKYIYDLWKYNDDIDRCWVPWEWCNYHSHTFKNNSIIIFAPSYNTLHSIKLDYDHLSFQRTQLYGNLWYEEKLAHKSSIADIDIPSRHEFNNSLTLKNKIMKKTIDSIYKFK
ncbi:hypothetical protein OAQ86_06880 [Candidatus Pseudothioglobus singularis]|nr:hypothetical protein [Candidatus Pseudothioglobus singularis]